MNYELSRNRGFRAFLILPGRILDVRFRDDIVPREHGVRLVAGYFACSHEDIAGALQDLRDSSAVSALERTAHAHYEYLDYDDRFGLARKCTWALADIGTPEAHQALARLAASDNSLIGGYARKRLVHWQEELHRKGAAPAGR